MIFTWWLWEEGNTAITSSKKSKKNIIWWLFCCISIYNNWRRECPVIIISLYVMFTSRSSTFVTPNCHLSAHNETARRRAESFNLLQLRSLSKWHTQTQQRNKTSNKLALSPCFYMCVCAFWAFVYYHRSKSRLCYFLFNFYFCFFSFFFFFTQWHMKDDDDIEDKKKIGKMKMKINSSSTVGERQGK